MCAIAGILKLEFNKGIVDRMLATMLRRGPDDTGMFAQPEICMLHTRLAVMDPARGHFDVITKFSLMPEADDAYRTIAADALKEVLKICPYIEMNTGAISRGWRKTPYPASYLLDVV